MYSTSGPSNPLNQLCLLSGLLLGFYLNCMSCMNPRQTQDGWERKQRSVDSILHVVNPRNVTNRTKNKSVILTSYIKILKTII